MTAAVTQWVIDNRLLLQYIGLISLLTFLVTPLIISFLIIRIPEDYFIRERSSAGGLIRRYHPVIRMLLSAAKNAAGCCLVLAGLAMLVLPGQGIITILIGLFLIDFPLKRKLELRIIRLHKVHTSINWMRRKAGRPPLRIDGDE